MDPNSSAMPQTLGEAMMPGPGLLPQVSAAYQRDPRRALVDALTQQFRESMQTPTRTGFAGAMKALQGVIGAGASGMLSSQYADANTKAQGDLHDAIAAMNGVPASTGPDGSAVAAQPPDIGHAMDILSRNPLLASTAMDTSLGMAMAQARARTELVNKLAEQHLMLDPSGRVVPMPGAADATRALSGATSQGTTEGKIAAETAPGAVTGEATRAGAVAGATKTAEIGAETAPGAIAGQANKAGAIAGATKKAEIAADTSPDAIRGQANKAGAIKGAESKYETVDVRPGGAVLPKSAVLGTGTTQPPVPAPAAGSAPVPAAAPPAPAPLQPATPPAAPGGAPGAPPTAPLPGGVRQLPGGGVQVPNPSIVEPLIRSDTEELKGDRENAIKGQQDIANIKMIQDFLPKVQTGFSAETRLEGARILKAIGVPDQSIRSYLDTDVASGQILQKKFVELSSAAARTMGAREPGSVISMFAKAYPNLGTDPQAIKLQTNALLMDRRRAMDLANAKTDYLNESVNGYQSSGQYRGLKGFNEQFSQAHPPEHYLHASEAMSGAPQAWQSVTDPQQQDTVINLIPSGTTYLAPDGKMRVRP
jgi:hypothetical protein